MNLYLLVLEGGGDIEYKLITKDVWNWIQNNKLTTTVETALREQYKKFYPSFNETEFQKTIKSIGVNSGSSKNDRALNAPTIKDGCLYSASEMMEFCKDNNVNVVEEYQGCIY